MYKSNIVSYLQQLCNIFTRRVVKCEIIIIIMYNDYKTDPHLSELLSAELIKIFFILMFNDLNFDVQFPIVVVVIEESL